LEWIDAEIGSSLPQNFGHAPVAAQQLEVQMIFYTDGKAMMIGDHVRIEKGQTAAIVVELIELPEHFAQWNVTEPGVLLKSPPFGLVFLPVSTFVDDPIVLEARGKG
jgi:hypothetical protein